MAAACSPDGDIDWPGIRAAAVSIGVREAARRAAINFPPEDQQTIVERIRKRAQREGWTDKDKSPSMSPRTTIDAVTGAIVQKAMSPIVPTGSEILLEQLKEHGDATKLGLAKASRRAVESTESMDGQTVLEYASKLKDVATIAEKVYGWGGDKAGDTINSWSQINVTINE